MKSQTEKNFWIDVIMFIALVFTSLSGIALWLGGPYKAAFVIQKVTFSLWQACHLFWASIALVSIIYHIIMHMKWLKALRGRRLSEMPLKLRANRIVNRIIWFTFIASTLFGIMPLVMRLCCWTDFVHPAIRLHVAFSLCWLTLVIVHLVFHRKWITYTLRGFQINRKPISQTME
jgi:hypothetical protein